MRRTEAVKIFAVAILLIAMLVGSVVPIFANTELKTTSDSTGESAVSDGGKPSYEYDSILYEENFDDTTVDLSVGKNTTGAAAGWIYAKGTSASRGSASIKNGKLYFSGDMSVAE